MGSGPDSEVSWPEMPDEPQICAPGEIDPEMLNYYAAKLA